MLSNAPEDTARAVSALPVAAHFEHLMFSCDLKLAKPDPECFRAALAVLRAGPADVIFLDDRPDNVAAAAALGIRSARFTDAEAARADLARYGVESLALRLRGRYTRRLPSSLGRSFLASSLLSPVGGAPPSAWGFSLIFPLLGGTALAPQETFSVVS